MTLDRLVSVTDHARGVAATLTDALSIHLVDVAALLSALAD
jgi:hypothetical protein